MQGYLAVLSIILLIGMVITRVLLLNKQGIKAMKFGKIDKKDFLIPPFALPQPYLCFFRNDTSRAVFNIFQLDFFYLYCWRYIAISPPSVA